MKSTQFISILLILNLFLFSSCKLDDVNDTYTQQQGPIPDTFSEYFGNEIARDFLGTVVDKNHMPIEGVNITIGDETQRTDSNGVFIIRNAAVNERFGYIKAEKIGYIHGSRSVVPSEGTNKVTIMLLDANVVDTIESGSEATVSLINGSSVSFDGNFVKEDDSAYSGSVNVILHHLDPADEDMEQQMPGMLYAQNEEGAERMLQTLGMLAVELRGSNGEDLNLAEGSTSEIKISVDTNLLSIAPATIPLWYFDEVNGYWKEEGQASLVGNMYVGAVSHFSFWNCDIPAEAVTLCVTVTNENGIEFSNLNIAITSGTYGTRGGITNEKGEVCGLVPSNESLSISLSTTDICGNIELLTEQIGPFTSDSSISIVVPNTSNTYLETITGNLNNCAGDPVTNGYIVLSYNDQVFTSLVNDGEIEISIIKCNDSPFTLHGVNLEDIETSDTVSYTFTTPLTNVGTISTCNVQEEYIEYLIDDDISVLFFDEIDVSFGTENFSIKRELENGGSAKFLLIAPTEVGNYLTSTSSALLNVTFPENGQDQYVFISQYGITIDVNSVGNSTGQYIDVSFSGTFENNGATRTIEGTAHVLRDN